MTGVALREHIRRNGAALGLIRLAPDEQERAVGGRDLLSGEHPTDSVGLAVRRFADLNPQVVILA